MRTTTKPRAGAAKKLRKLPAIAAKAVVDIPKRAHTPKKVVKVVQDELARLLARGYSVEAVGNELRGAGIEISAGTLRSYARSASKQAAEAASAPAPVSKRKVATRKAASTSAPASSPSSSAAAVPAPGARKLSTPPAAPAKGRVPAAKSAASPAPGLRDFKLAKSATFVVRPDTPDSDL